MKKRLVAICLTLIFVMCVFPVSAFADFSNTASNNRSVNINPRNLTFYDYLGNEYIFYSGIVISQGSSWTGAVIIIQEILTAMVTPAHDNNLNPQGIDGVFGNNTKAAVICFQVKYMGPSEADGAVGAKTWGYLYDKYVNVLGSFSMSHLVPNS